MGMRRRPFTPEFKRDAINVLRSTGRPVAQICGGAHAEVWDWRRFGRGASVMGSVGLVPSEYSSGGADDPAALGGAFVAGCHVRAAVGDTGGLAAVADVVVGPVGGDRHVGGVGSQAELNPVIGFVDVAGGAVAVSDVAGDLAVEPSGTGPNDPGGAVALNNVVRESQQGGTTLVRVAV